MKSVSSQDLSRLSEETAKLYTPGGLRELPFRMLSIARKLFECEHLSYTEFGKGHFVTVLDPTIRPELEASFQRFSDQHPSITYLNESDNGEVVKISDFLPHREWLKTDLYNEFFREIGIRYQLACLFRQGDTQIGFAANREGKDFSERERLLLSYLLPHFRQAYENALVYDRMQHSMDQRGYGTVVFDPSGKILYCTRRAQESIERYYGGIKNQKLPKEIRNWALQAVASWSAETYSSGALLPLKKQRGDICLTIRISPNHGSDEHTLTTDEQSTAIPLKVFRKHGHSPREAEVLSWIAQGKTNPEIAIILNISTKTVAHHVERILAKIGVESRGVAAAWAQDVLLSERMNYTPFH